MTTPNQTSIESTTQRRLHLSEQANLHLTCPSCQSDQVQLIAYMNQTPAHWRCRTCHKGFEWEPQEPQQEKSLGDIVRDAFSDREIFNPDAIAEAVRAEVLRRENVPQLREDIRRLINDKCILENTIEAERNKTDQINSEIEEIERALSEAGCLGFEGHPVTTLIRAKQCIESRDAAWKAHHEAVEENHRLLRRAAAPAERLTCLNCGLPMTRNPHPQAGNPADLLHVGASFECLPCTYGRAYRRFEKIKRLNQVILAASHLLMAATGPTEEPFRTEWLQTKQRWLELVKNPT